MMKKLPIGIQTFSRLIEEDYIYIDKTKEVYELIKSGAIYYFLSRPRRFGKSLFLDTLQEVFEGNQKLFEGLYIYDKWDWSVKYPVIKLSFAGDLRSGSSLKKVILNLLKTNQKSLDVQCEEIEEFGICFKELIEKVYEKYNQKVVVLVDEYDKAILDNLDQIEVARENREIIKSLYTILKDTERYIKFAFLTGVSKFSKASIFSGLNMLVDISLNKKYGNICGYTQYNIENEFKEYFDGVDLEKVKNWYNGYNFLKDPMYNPFDILQFLANDKVFDNYWFITGTPTFLVKLIEQNSYFLPKLANLSIGKNLLDSFDIENIDLEVILYQSGYLTIDKAQITPFETIEYKLKLPNKEVKISFNDMVINYITNNSLPTIKNDIYMALFETDLDKFKNSLVSIFATIPYNNFSNNHIQNYEGFYASVVYVYLQSLGLDIIGEDVTNLGRIDLTVKINDLIYIIEFKVGFEDALAQIKDKSYHQKYLSENKDIYLVGINFDKNDKNIKEFQWEKL
jgi:hypothetical protein